MSFTVTQKVQSFYKIYHELYQTEDFKYLLVNKYSTNTQLISISKQMCADKKQNNIISEMPQQISRTLTQPSCGLFCKVMGRFIVIGAADRCKGFIAHNDERLVV